jgi:hypothetical protein
MGAVTKTNITIELVNGGWALQAMDTIEIDGCFWLVPHWTLSADQATRQPSRIVSMTMVETGSPASDPEAFGGLPIPETLLFDGHIPLSLARLFIVEECPDLWWPAGDAD